MFRLKMIFSALVMIFGLAMHSTAMADFNMNCRAGGNMRMSHNGPSNMVLVDFGAAVKGTRERPLRPGECAWVDRGLRQGEPHRLCHKNVRDVTVFFRAGGRGLKIKSNTAPYVSKILSGGYFSLRVANDRHGCFVVSRVNSFTKAQTISGR